MSKELNTDDMLNVTKRLSKILEEEISMIKGMKLAQLHTLYDEKIKLTSVLEGYKEILSLNPNIIKSFPKRTIDELRKVTEIFETLLKEDERQIKKAKKVHQIIMEALKVAVTKRMSASSVYNKNGVMDFGKKKIIYTPPVSINESF